MPGSLYLTLGGKSASDALKLEASLGFFTFGLYGGSILRSASFSHAKPAYLVGECWRNVSSVVSGAPGLRKESGRLSNILRLSHYLSFYSVATPPQFVLIIWEYNSTIVCFAFDTLLVLTYENERMEAVC